MQGWGSWEGSARGQGSTEPTTLWVSQMTFGSLHRTWTGGSEPGVPTGTPGVGTPKQANDSQQPGPCHRWLCVSHHGLRQAWPITGAHQHHLGKPLMPPPSHSTPAGHLALPCALPPPRGLTQRESPNSKGKHRGARRWAQKPRCGLWGNRWKQACPRMACKTPGWPTGVGLRRAVS